MVLGIHLHEKKKKPKSVSINGAKEKKISFLTHVES